jgi:hypothetical protein
MPINRSIPHLWAFENGAVRINGNRVEVGTSIFDLHGTLILELERFPGAECVLRVHVAGRETQEIRGLPQHDTLYPIVCLVNDRQKVSMIPALSTIATPSVVSASSLEPAVMDSQCNSESGALSFSRDYKYRSPDVVLSRDEHSACLLPFKCCGWVRADRGFEADCGIVRWAVKLGSEDGGCVYIIGVATELLDSFRMPINRSIPHLWAFENGAVRINGNRVEVGASIFDLHGTLILELERFPGAECVLRVHVAGRETQEIRGLPQHDTLYPIVCLVNDRQKVSMVRLPR